MSLPPIQQLQRGQALGGWEASSNVGGQIAHQAPALALQNVMSGLETDEARSLVDDRRIVKELAIMARLVKQMERLDEHAIDAQLSKHAGGSRSAHNHTVQTIIAKQEHLIDHFTISFQRFDTAISDALKGIDKSLSMQIGLATNLVTHATLAIESSRAYFPRTTVAASIKEIRRALDELKKELSKDTRNSLRAARRARHGKRVSRSERGGITLLFRKMHLRHELYAIKASEHGDYYPLVRALTTELSTHRIRSDFFVLLHRYIADFKRIDQELAAYLRDLKRLFGYGVNLLERAEKAMIPTMEIFRNEPELRHSGFFQEFDRLRTERREFVREERFQSRSDAHLVEQIDECRAALPALVRVVQASRSAAHSAEQRAQGSSTQTERIARRS